MIGRITGTVVELDPEGSVVLDTGGVGYEVLVSLQTLCRLQAGEKASLSIHTHVREDQITLYGFSDSGERALFRRLLSVSGIGARMALNLMSGMPTEQLLRAIENGDDALLARTPGIGRKTAQRVILELRGKLTSPQAAAAGGGAVADVRSALENLGYKPAQIDRALAAIEPADFETMLKAALKALAG